MDKTKFFRASQVFQGKVMAFQELEAKVLRDARKEAGREPDPLQGQTWWLDVKEIPDAS